MYVAQILLISGWGIGDANSKHNIAFNDLEKAKAEYDRVAALMGRKAKRANDLPPTIEINGDSGSKVTIPTEDLRSISLCDLALANAQEEGIRAAYPNLYRS